jgi:NADH:ubiquinone oxidoreductase subunit 6 (subunit J)
MVELVAFSVLAVTSVVTGVLVFVVDSMARATFALLASFLTVGGVLLLLSADFLGAILLLMLVGEMVIMVIFMIMFMMNPAGLMPMTMVHNHRFSIGVPVALFVALAAGIFLTPWPDRTPSLPPDATVQLGEALFGPKMIVMMTIGVGLFATMVGGVLLSTHRGRYDRYGDNLDRPAADPIPSGRSR